MKIRAEHRVAVSQEKEQNKRKMPPRTLELLRANAEKREHDADAERVLIQTFEKIAALNWREAVPHTAFKPLRQVLERISRPVRETEMNEEEISRYYERRTLKLQRSLANGLKPAYVHDVVFLAELTSAEWEMSEEDFYTAITENWPQPKIQDPSPVKHHMATCVVCREQFQTQRADQKNCSARCRNKASYRRGRRGNPKSVGLIDTLRGNQVPEGTENKQVDPALLVAKTDGCPTGYTSAF
jgi:hypothetical protein